MFSFILSALLISPAWGLSTDLLVLATNLLPAELKAGLDEYRAALGGEVGGGANAAIVQYYNRMLDKPCFAKLANKFYQREWPGDRINPKLLSKMANGEFWKAALEDAGGNSNVALALVGVCGHDNYGNNTPLKNGCPEGGKLPYWPGSLV